MQLTEVYFFGYVQDSSVLLLGIFRTAPCPSATRGCPSALIPPRGRPAPKTKLQFFFKLLLVIYDTRELHQGAT
jgi:hypothetical protein